MSTEDLTRANRDTTLLAPFFQTRLLMALNECHDHGYPILVTEAYRGPARQNYLFEQGRTREGKRVTDAKAWESFHQYGLAVDLAFLNGRKPYWPDPKDSLWERVHQIFERFSFEDISRERAHVQITAGMPWKEAYMIYRRETKPQKGLEGVWDLVEKRLNA